MELERIGLLRGRKKELWKDFLRRADLEPDENVERTVLVWDNGELVATGSRQGDLLKCIAVDEDRQGEGITATLITALRQDAFAEGRQHLFLYTKPQNEFMFSSLFFYPIAKSGKVLLMESKKEGIRAFVDGLPKASAGEKIGAAVMHCNPFTLGHRYLVETAAKNCDHLYVFVLSEGGAMFSPEDRMAMVKAGTADLPNVTVLPTGPYLISSATFPTYFLKDREQAGTVQCLLDIDIFCKYYAPKFGITRRYVGTEPLSPMTNQYNQALLAALPEKGIAVQQISRLEQDDIPVSASAVRAAMAAGDTQALHRLVPETTYQYLLKEAKL